METIKEVKKYNTIYRLRKGLLDDHSLFVEWNRVDVPRSLTRGDWIYPTKREEVYFTMQRWDELFKAIKILGGVKLDMTSSYVSDWGNGDTDTFTMHYFDMSKCKI